MNPQEIAYLRCIFCGHTRVVRSKRYDGGELKLGELTTPPERFGVIQIREPHPGPGRGHRGEKIGGLRKIRELSITEALNDPQFRPLIQQVRNRFIAVARAYLSAGIISLEDL